MRSNDSRCHTDPFEPIILLISFGLLDRQRIGKPERHEVYHRFLTPMRKLATVDIQFYI